MSVRRFRRHSATAVALAGLFLTAFGCTGDSNADPDPLPSSSNSGTPSSATTSPTPTPTGWESEFAAEQLAEYEEALGRWEDYERESEPLWADPKPTDATLRFFRSYFYAPEQMQSLLERNAQVEIKIEGLSTVLWSRATRIKASAVTIRQCVDLTSQTVTQFGEPTTGRPKKPQLREVSLSRPTDGAPYLISNVSEGRGSCASE
jgi:hypothetical protein